jgi:hypothetical protein
VRYGAVYGERVAQCQPHHLSLWPTCIHPQRTGQRATNAGRPTAPPPTRATERGPRSMQRPSSTAGTPRGPHWKIPPAASVAFLRPRTLHGASPPRACRSQSQPRSCGPT